jgi:hypothetical protein
MSGWPASLALLALTGATVATAAERGAPPRRAGATEAVDAEMLRDLDLLSSPDYGRDREVARRMGFFERMRLLDFQRAQEASNAPMDGGVPASAPAARPAPAPPPAPTPMPMPMPTKDAK